MTKFPFSGCGVNLPLVNTHIVIAVAQEAAVSSTAVARESEKVKEQLAKTW